MNSHIQHLGGLGGPNFAEMINFFPDPCFAIDLQGRVIAWNQEMEALTGVQAHDMLGKGDYEYALSFYGYRRPMSIDLVFTWDEEIARKYKHVKKCKEILASEFENPPFRPDNSLFWNKARKITNAKGECIGALEVIRDMTYWKKSKQEVKHTEAEKALILNTTSEMIAYLDLDMRFKWINKASVTGLGRHMDDVIGRHCYEIWHNRTAPCEGCPLVKSKLTRLPQQAEIITPDGRCWLARGYPVFDESQNITGMIEFMLEITDRNRMEEQLRDTSDSLAEAQRIAKIEN
jgi:PAS domain-containing protein